MKTEQQTEAWKLGYTDARTQCEESQDTGTPDGGWDSWIVNGVGLREACRILGEPERENQDGWSESMTRKLCEYHAGAMAAAEELQAEWDADE